MENLLRVLLTVFLVGMVVMVIIFFTLFGILPAEEVTKTLKGETPTSTRIIERIHTIERVIEKGSGETIPRETSDSSGGTSSDNSAPPPRNEGFEGGENSFQVVFSGGGFSPQRLVAALDSQVTISLISEDGEYTLKIPDFGISQTVTMGKERIIAFQTLQSGEFEITCGGCKEGVVGTFIINK